MSRTLKWLLRTLWSVCIGFFGYAFHEETYGRLFKAGEGWLDPHSASIVATIGMYAIPIAAILATLGLTYWAFRAHGTPPTVPTAAATVLLQSYLSIVDEAVVAAIKEQDQIIRNFRDNPFIG